MSWAIAGAAILAFALFLFAILRAGGRADELADQQLDELEARKAARAGKVVDLALARRDRLTRGEILADATAPPEAHK